MFAAAIRIDRTVETDIGRVVARDDRPGMFDGDGGAQRRRGAVDVFGRVEPVAIGRAVERSGPRRAEVGRGAAA